MQKQSYAPSAYNSDLSVPPPPPSLNGGLYSGEPFAAKAPYGNIPVVPDVGYMIHYNLRSANPPPGAIFQFPGNIRPGNNYQSMPGVRRASNYNLLCNSSSAKEKVINDRFSKYSYL